jgi:hypothetical protein
VAAGGRREEESVSMTSVVRSRVFPAARTRVRQRGA